MKNSKKCQMSKSLNKKTLLWLRSILKIFVFVNFPSQRHYFIFLPVKLTPKVPANKKKKEECFYFYFCTMFVIFNSANIILPADIYS